MSLMALMAGLSLVGAQAAPGDAPTYDEAVRCSGLSQAASEMEGGESAEGRALYDAALYWSLTSGQTARGAGRTDAQADADQTQARIRAVRELAARDAVARADLARCRARTPHLG